MPGAEVLAVLKGEGIGFRVLVEFRRNRILIVETMTRQVEFLHRLALTKLSGEFIKMSSDLAEIAPLVEGKIPPGSRIAVRGSLFLEKELGAMLKGRGFSIDLEQPEFTILLFKIDNLNLAAVEIPLNRNFERRKPRFRPYFHPTSMHPRIARALVNLAGVKKGDTILDPFCGTGGILIEAGLAGMNVRGSDINEEMVNGCKRNLEHYGVKGGIKQTDAMDIGNEFNNIDAIVTDLPYGRSSFTSEKDMEKLYNGFISVAGNLLQKNKHLVVVMPDKFTPESGEFSVTGEFLLYVHKSLSRKIRVMKKE